MKHRYWEKALLGKLSNKAGNSGKLKKHKPYDYKVTKFHHGSHIHTQRHIIMCFKHPLKESRHPESEITVKE